MISLSAPSRISLVGQFLRNAGYDLAHLGHELGLGDGLYPNHENLEPLLARTEGDSVLSVAARLFFVAWPVEESLCRKVLPETFLAAAFDCGLLVQEGSDLASTASLVPFRGSIIAYDSCRSQVALPDMVTGPSGSTNYPARLAIGGQGETTLDLGTGSGALALEAARYSSRVVGTDISPRALLFAEFNALLNHITNIEWRCGDAFDPVAGQRFSRIVANPPFFLSPEKTFIYCDSPLDLDGFTARLARECPAHLEEGGFYQMLCEWVDLEDLPWEKRLRHWTSESGCDVLVLLAPSTTPMEYAEKRTQEARFMRTGGMDQYFSRQHRYLKDRRVKQVMAGVVNMRKRSGGANWFAQVRTEPVGLDLGQDVRDRFDALTFLSTCTDQQILACRLKLASHVVLEKRATADSVTSQWQYGLIELVKVKGLVDRLRLDETVSQFLPLLNGERTVCEFASVVSLQSKMSLEEAERRCLQLGRRLLQSNFVTLEQGQNAI